MKIVWYKADVLIFDQLTVL